MSDDAGSRRGRRLVRVASIVVTLTTALVTGAEAQTPTTVESAAAEHGDEAVAVWWVFVAAFVIGAAVLVVRARKNRPGR